MVAMVTLLILGGISRERNNHDPPSSADTSFLSHAASPNRDVLVQTGVKYVIVCEGLNDFVIPGLIGRPAEDVTAEQVIQGIARSSIALIPWD